MSSGYGVRGTVGRCYGFFQDLQNCALELRAKKYELSEEEMKERKKKCGMYREDYLECLHQKKRIAREEVIAQAKKEAEGDGHGH